MHSTTAQHPASVIALVGLVAMPEWAAIRTALESRLRERPAEPLVIDCGRVSRISPGAFFALTRFVESVPGRVCLKNWPSTICDLVSSQLLVLGSLERVLDSLRAAARRVAGLDGDATAEVGQKIAALAAAVSALRRDWGTGEPPVPCRDTNSADAPDA